MRGRDSDFKKRSNLSLSECLASNAGITVVLVCDSKSDCCKKTTKFCAQNLVVKEHSFEQNRREKSEFLDESVPDPRQISPP